ncbi:MAG: alpha/beta hydrolase [Kangiellaceae bacterium]|jgi:pimeloyl-ACP methyl ester carboxylesterase|nr:alpha/beta hydrolase [Kangiellaceae bacterium]
MTTKLYLIPGTMCTELLWSLVKPLLDQSIELVHLDIPKNMSFDQLAEHFDNVFIEEKVSIVGFSLGGYIATYYAMKYPHRVEKIFSIANSPTSLRRNELKARREALKYFEDNEYTGMSRARIVSFLDNDNHDPKIIDLIKQMDKQQGHEQLVSQYEHTSNRQDLSEAVISFPFKTHFYYSDFDPMINNDWFDEIRTKSANLSFFSTSGSGHMLPLEKPKELASYINAWAQL